jgi:hypothetical protein
MKAKTEKPKGRKKTAAKKKAPVQKKPHGRPSKFTEALADEICERLSKAEPLAVVCRDEHMPADRTVREWQQKDEKFAAAIARAREAGFDLMAEECLEIADDARNDYMEKLANEGDEQAVKATAFDAEHVQRSKLRIETRLKLLAKWDPKRYGEKQHIEHSGKVGLEALVAGGE